jgi:hypothetical protein
LRRIAIHKQVERYEILHDVLAAAIIAWRKIYFANQAALEEKLKLAEEIERERQRENYRLIFIFSLMSVGAIIFLAGSLIFALQQADNASLQSNIASTAQANAQNQADIAKINAAKAITAQADANNQAMTAQASAAKAVTAQADAETQRHLAQNNFAKFLAFQSQYYATNNQPDLGLLLGIESIKTINLPETRASLFFGLAQNPDLRTFLHDHTGYVTSVVFSPDGKVLASGNDAKHIILWDVGSGKQLNTLKGYNGSVTNVVFSPDGKLLASGGNDMSIIL